MHINGRLIFMFETNGAFVELLMTSISLQNECKLKQQVWQFIRTLNSCWLGRCTMPTAMLFKGIKVSIGQMLAEQA